MPSAKAVDPLDAGRAAESRSRRTVFRTKYDHSIHSFDQRGLTSRQPYLVQPELQLLGDLFHRQDVPFLQTSARHLRCAVR